MPAVANSAAMVDDMAAKLSAGIEACIQNFDILCIRKQNAMLAVEEILNYIQADQIDITDNNLDDTMLNVNDIMMNLKEQTGTDGSPELQKINEYITNLSTNESPQLQKLLQHIHGRLQNLRSKNGDNVLATMTEYMGMNMPKMETSTQTDWYFQLSNDRIVLPSEYEQDSATMPKWNELCGTAPLNAFVKFLFAKISRKMCDTHRNYLRVIVIRKWSGFDDLPIDDKDSYTDTTDEVDQIVQMCEPADDTITGLEGYERYVRPNVWQMRDYDRGDYIQMVFFVYHQQKILQLMTQVYIVSHEKERKISIKGTWYLPKLCQVRCILRNHSSWFLRRFFVVTDRQSGRVYGYTRHCSPLLQPRISPNNRMFIHSVWLCICMVIYRDGIPQNGTLHTDLDNLPGPDQLNDDVWTCIKCKAQSLGPLRIIIDQQWLDDLYKSQPGKPDLTETMFGQEDVSKCVNTLTDIYQNLDNVSGQKLFKDFQRVFTLGDTIYDKTVVNVQRAQLQP